MKIPLLVLAGATVFLGATVRAQLASSPLRAPAEALVAAAQADIAAHPGDALAHFTLGRIHYLAFVRGTREVPVLRPVAAGERPAIAGDAAIAFELYEARQKQASELALRDIGERGPRPSPEKASAYEEARGKRARQLEEQDWYPRGEATTAERATHAAAALAAYREALQLDPQVPAYLLGAGLLQEKIVRWIAQEKPPALPDALRRQSVAGARDSCLRAFRAAVAADAALPARPEGGLASLVSFQAGEAFLRLSEGARTRLRPGDSAAVREVRQGLRRLKELPVTSLPPL